MDVQKLARPFSEARAFHLKQPVEYVKDVATKGVIVRLLGKLYNAAT